MNSWLLEFRFNKDVLTTKELAKHFIETVKTTVNKSCGDCKVVYAGLNNLKEEGFVVLSRLSSKFNALIQGSVDGLLTIDINATSDSSVNFNISEDTIDQIRADIFAIEDIFQRETLEFKRLPAIKRGRTFSAYDTFPFDNRLLECDYDEVVFDQNSEFQNVRIMHSTQFGNVLVLDNEINLGESDLAYTVAITRSNKENYEGKNVLVLGGGDGGILNHLKDGRFGRPKMITMVDIDELVMKACRVHLRGACGDALDDYEGDNYKIIVGDAVAHLKQCIKGDYKFDYIISDLTDIPVTPSPIGSHWDLLRLILNLSMRVLKPGGKYLTHGHGANNKQGLKMYEDELKLLSPSVQFEKETVCVPSFMELWVFYAIWKIEA